MKRDIAVTWPKTKPLDAYLGELERARQQGLVINYRVATPPRWPDLREDHETSGWDYGARHPRCFMVYDGLVRGWTEILWTGRREAGEVADWPAGWYIVRDPTWHPVDPVPMKGFQGWRWVVKDVLLALVELIGVVFLLAFLWRAVLRAVFVYQVTGLGFIGWLTRLIARDR